MRLSISHSTRYRFTAPQSRLVQLLRLTPQDSVDQTVVHWHIGVDCDVRLREARDGYGNRVTMLYADGPIEGIEISVDGEVLTAGDVGLVRGVAEPLPVALYRRPTDRTLASDAMRALLADAPADAIERLHAINLALYRRLTLVEARQDDGAAASDVFTEGDASPRDFAHLFIALARADGVPARYVSGYRPGADGGAHAPHAWAEAHVEGLGWVAFDPSRGVSADAGYVRVAVALDAAGAAPVAGSRLGEGRERMDVDVSVEPLGGDG